MDLISVNFISNSSSLTALQDQFAQENIIKAELEFVFNNTFERSFTSKVEFLDENDQVTYSFSTVNIPSNTNEVKHIETIVFSENKQFPSSAKVRVQLTISPSPEGSVLDLNNLKTLEVKSVGTYFLKY